MTSTNQLAGDRVWSPAIVQSSVQKPRRIVFIGNCQALAVLQLYKRFVAGRTRDVLSHVETYNNLADSSANLIRQADLIVEQLFDMKQQADTNTIKTSAPRVFFPMVTAAFLWPFGGQAHPRNQRDAFTTTAPPYPAEIGDSYLTRRILAGTSAELAVSDYEALDIGRRVNLDRLYELVIDRQRVRDEASDHDIATIIESHFRTEQIFLTPYHPNTRIAIAVASQLFRRMGAEGDEIDRLENCVRVTPFPRSELPIHPSVRKHWSLTWAPADKRYRYQNEGSFSFREYAIRYYNYTWNEDLENGMALLRERNFSDALSHFRKALVQSPECAAAYNGIRQALQGTGAKAEALEAATKAVSLEPESAPYRAALGNMLHGAGRFAEAEEQLALAIEIEPTEPHYRSLMIGLFRQTGRLGEALQQAGVAHSLDPYSVPLLLRLSDIAEALGDQAIAENALRNAIKYNPLDPAIHSRLARVASHQGNMEEAVSAAREAVKLAPTSVEHRTTLSALCWRAGESKDALKEAIKAVLLNPLSGLALSQLGQVLLDDGELEAAALTFQKACQLAPNEAHFWHQMSVAHARNGRRNEAIDAARTAIEKQPTKANRYTHLASLLISAKLIEDAISAQARAIDLVPDNVGFRATFCEMLQKGGQSRKALDQAREVLRRDPMNARAIALIVAIEEEMGNNRTIEPSQSSSELLG